MPRRAKKNSGVVPFLNENFMGVSILASTIIISGTLIYVFGGGASLNLGDSPSGAYGEEAADAGNGESPISVENLKLIARAVGVDGGEFDSCLDSGANTEAVQGDIDYGVSIGVNGTPSMFINGISVVGAVPFEQISSVIERALAGETGTVDVKVEGAPVLGDPSAPVTLVEFSDYECPFCESFFSGSLPEIKDTYVDSGKVKFVYKDFPLEDLHPHARKAAEAARCVRDQLGEGGYWKMHDKLFGVQGV